MASELTTSKLNAEQHLLLDQPLLRLPLELSRKTFKSSQRVFERERDQLVANLKSTTQSAPSKEPADTLSSLDSMITRMQGLKRKLETLHGEEQSIHKQSRARLQHLQQLYEIPSLVDVKYDEWSRTRLNRLLVDYLLRCGYGESAKALAQEKGIGDLVDVDAFIACQRVVNSLKNGKTQECLAWCQENKQALKKVNSDLEFQLRFQQFIEMVRLGWEVDQTKLSEAIMYARKHLAAQTDAEHLKLAQRAGGLLANPPSNDTEPYRSLYSRERWDYLSELFLQTHHTLFSLPPRPLLQIALSAGLSALKTPSCHSAYASSSSNAASSTTSVCPICSTELNELARNVPYAHHTKSYVEPDPVVLPNGRIYGKARLLEINAKLGVQKGFIRDPIDTNLMWDDGAMKKVFIS